MRRNITRKTNRFQELNMKNKILQQQVSKTLQTIKSIKSFLQIKEK